MASIKHLLASFALATTTTAAPAILERDLIPIPDQLLKHSLYGAPADDYNCRSAHNPVVLLHGLSANREVDLNMLAQELRDEGYCTFSMTYGANPLLPWIGGLTDMRASAAEIATYINGIVASTGAAKVDIVGHSEGGVQAIYVPMTQAGIAAKVERVIALGPAVHGADYFGFTGILDVLGPLVKVAAQMAIKLVGCAACVDMMDGPEAGGNIYNDFKNAPRISQLGNKMTVIMSKADTLVPPEKSAVLEDGVRNVYIQDICPDDKVGHAGLMWDKSVWGLIKNALTEQYDAAVECQQGLPV